MSRLAIFCAAVLCASGCGGSAKSMTDPPPALGDGSWVRQTVDRPSLETAPEAIRRYQPKEWVKTEYRKGDSTVKVDVYRMPGEPTAFEARQKWLGETGVASMNHGDLFVVVASATEPAQGLAQFLRTVEAGWLSAQAH